MDKRLIENVLNFLIGPNLPLFFSPSSSVFYISEMHTETLQMLGNVSKVQKVEIQYGEVILPFPLISQKVSR